MIIRAVLLAVACLSAAAHVEAASYYLKGDCQFNGNGTAPDCAASGGAAGAFNSEAAFQTALSSCAAGDIFYVRAKGDGAPHVFSGNADHPLWHGGLRVGCSGTEGKPLVITNYPGEIGFLAHCTNAQKTYSACDNATISTAEHDYVQIGSTDGLYNPASHLKVRGVVTVHGRDATHRAKRNVVQGIECFEGWEFAGDGNQSCLRLEYNDFAIARYNYIHDIAVLPGGGQQSSGSGIKIYTSLDSIVEHNSIVRVCTAGCDGDGRTSTQAGGIDDKADSIRNVHRFNYIENVPTCIRIQNQQAIGNSTGTQIYGNICVRTPGGVTDAQSSGEGAIDLLTSTIDDIAIYNNTFDGFEIVVYGKSNVKPGAVAFYNNISSASAYHFYDDGSAFTYDDLGTVNYNAYDSDAAYQVDGQRGSLGAWRSGSGKDAGSHEEGKVCGGFVKGADTNYHIAAGPCTTGGRVKGVSTGAPVEQGAYGVTACVGHLCRPGSKPK